MSRLPNRKKFLILTACLAGSSCADRGYACHEWTAQEIRQMKSADIALPDDSPLHGLIRDYERLCAR